MLERVAEVRLVLTEDPSNHVEEPSKANEIKQFLSKTSTPCKGVILNGMDRAVQL